MAKDKYKAVWVSHSSIADFLKCPRLYYLRNVYKDPKTGHKITIMQPPLALGQAIHDIIDNLINIPAEKRLLVPLTESLESNWASVAGTLGGFKTPEEEKRYKDRGVKMLKTIEENPGPILNKAIRIKADGGLPYYWLSEEDNIILCGKIDWLEYLEKEDAVHIIDFKTGKNEEPENSLQLPIYHLLAANTQSRKVAKASYWYLDSSTHPVEVKLPNLTESYDQVYEVARRIKLGRQISYFKCPKGGCFACKPLERVLSGEAELVGVSQYQQDIYILNNV
jgi:RecB family exonuclease